MPIQPGFSLENKPYTGKRGHGHHWYVRKKPSGVDIWGYVNACILLFLFIIQTLKFFTLFIFHYFLFILMFPFCLHATSALYKPITILFCIIMRFWIFDILLKFLYVLDVSYWNDVQTTWKRRVHVVSTRNTHGVFVGTSLEVSSLLTVLSKSNRLIYYFY